MGKLIMKGFGADSEKSSDIFDVSSLEVNPRFNAQGDGSGDTTLEDLDQGTEVIENPDQSNITQVLEDEPDVSTGSSNEINNDQRVDSVPTQAIVTEEDIFKSLSEKLGREVKSLEDLTVKQEVEELDPQVKVINDWKLKTGRPIEDFFKYQKDYSQASDLEVAREALRLEYPTFSELDLDIELENFIATDEDLDSEARKKEHELKKYATKGRKALEGLKTELGQPSQNSYTPEVKSKLEYADQVQAQIKLNEKEQEKYNEGIVKSSLSTSELRLNLAEDLSIDFKVSEQERKSIPKLLAEMPHWKTEKGEWNYQAVVQDAIKIKHFDAMVKLAYEQGLNSGKEDLLKKAKNSTLGLPPSQEQGTQTKKPTIEGLDKLLGGQKLSMKFGRNNQ